MKPSPPNTRPQTLEHEQLQDSQISNSRPQILDPIGLFIHFLLSQVIDDAGSSFYRGKKSVKPPQNPDLVQSARCCGKFLTSILVFEKDDQKDGKLLSLQRRNRKKRRGLVLVEPRSLWRLGLVTASQGASLCNYGAAGSMARRREEQFAREGRHMDENWEECSPLWINQKGQQGSKSQRLYFPTLSLNYVKGIVLLPAYWTSGIKLTIVGVEPLAQAHNAIFCYRHASFENSKCSIRKAKHLSFAKGTRMPFEKVTCCDQIVSTEPSNDPSDSISAMVEETLKGSITNEPKEAGPLGTKQDEQKNKTFVETIILLAEQSGVKEFSLHPETSCLNNSLHSGLYDSHVCCLYVINIDMKPCRMTSLKPGVSPTDKVLHSLYKHCHQLSTQSDNKLHWTATIKEKHMPGKPHDLSLWFSEQVWSLNCVL